MYTLDESRLPARWPTHFAPDSFWEELGRTVACFGALEQVLGKAVFALTATQPCKQLPDEDVEKWVRRLEGALKDPLGARIASFEKAMRDDVAPARDDESELVAALRKAAQHRNVLCHGSWHPGSSEGFFEPFFVSRGLEEFVGEYDAGALVQVQLYVAALIQDCINVVTLKGLQFPGSTGPGRPVW